jgi:hypothetical protein
MKAVKIINSYWQTDGAGVAVETWKGGETYPLTPESQAQVNRGNAELVDMADDQPAEVKTDAPAEDGVTARKKRA